MEYTDFYDYDPEKANRLLQSSKVSDQADGLLMTVLGSEDYNKSDELIYQFTQSSEEKLKETAVLCIGHLVRIYRKIALDKYLPVLNRILKTQNPALIDNAEDAIENIWIFYDKDKILPWTKDDSCISRFFKVLQIGYEAEREEKYEEAIKKIAKLRENESNPSVIKLQDVMMMDLKRFE